MRSFRGIWVALATPFNNGEIDLSALEMLVSTLREDGIAGLVVCGTTGEAAAMSHEEQLSVLDAVLQWVPADQVIMGLAGNNLRELLEFQQQIQRRSIAGLLVPAPYYIRPSQAGLESFFQLVADASTVPVIIYDIPYRTGVRIERETLRRIVQHGNVAAVKDCSGDIETTTSLINDGYAEVLAGEDTQIFSTLCMGGAGAISASAHIRSDLYVKMQSYIEAQDLANARSILYRLLPWIRIAFAEPNPAPVKAALSQLSLIREELRQPMQGCTPQTHERISDVLAQLAR
ncbi:4-hydroxy-tetrahydrodipicolinate synthase [Pseudomonas asiatica]|uniref:4-hydroxy-tetrahydrodipicolinate synthase n=1 Tax=Pseudomonas asiatica TaxID=2219225 RepID=UPI00383AD958